MWKFPIFTSPVKGKLPGSTGGGNGGSMSVQSVLATLEADAKTVFAKVATDYTKTKQVWKLISSPEVRALAVKLVTDAINVVKNAQGAVNSVGLNVTLDAAAVTSVQQFLEDAKAGDGVIASDLEMLGIKL